MRILPQSLRCGALAKAGRAISRRLGQDCLLCGAGDAERIVCAACCADLPRLHAPFCRRCAQPLGHDELCGRCLAQPPHYDWTRAVFRYDFPVDQLIQSFKYSHRLALAGFFAEELAALGERPVADLVVPLPLHPERLRERGFNQALELARVLCRAWALPLDAHSCRRTRNTSAQATQRLRERAKNVRNAFSCSTDLTGKRIALVDDVMTSGATLGECARTLKLHGAAEVSVFVVARALIRSD